MAWTDNLFRWLGFGRYNSTLPTVAEAAVEELQVDSRGRLRVSIDAAAVAIESEVAEPATRYVSSALETQANAKASAGVVRTVSVLSTSAADRYLMLVNKASPVLAGDAPFYRALVPAGAQVEKSFEGGHTFATGLRVALSSTATTWTDPGVAEGLFFVEMD